MNNELSKQLSRVGDPTLCPVAIVIKNDCILRGHRNYTPDKWKKISVWTIPGGRCDAGETLEQTLRREVAEETGINKLEIVDYIGEVPGAKEGDIVPIFYCKTEQDPVLMEPEKFDQWKWLPIDEYLAETPTFNPAAKNLTAQFLIELRKED